MENKLVAQQDKQVLSAAEVRTQVNLIQEVMKSVMKENTHFGIIPGCPKPSLYKAGAEKIAVTFRIAVKTEVENLSTDDHAKFRITASACTAKGDFLGSATGVCSSLEEKYKWKKPVCDEEFEETPENRRREKWKAGYYDRNAKKAMPAKKIKQIRVEPADIENTVLQMADKRAYVAVIRKVTAASDVFTQDIEDLPSEVIVTEEEAKAPPEMPQATEPQKKEADADSPYQCGECGVSITLKVYDYSVKKFGKPLCFNCQKGAK